MTQRQRENYDGRGRTEGAVIAAEVRYDRTLKANAKLLYGELAALCGRYGYCWATNEYLAGLYGLAPATVSRLISQLESRGYVRCEMAATPTGSERRIYAGAGRPAEGGMEETGEAPLDEREGRGPRGNVKAQYEKNKKERTPHTPQGEAAGNGGGRNPRRTRGPRQGPDWKPERFARFWDYYPRGESKQAAIRAWDRLRPPDELIDTMALALRRQMESRSWRAGVGIPYASTWLNDQRWTDADKPEARSSGSGWADDPEAY